MTNAVENDVRDYVVPSDSTKLFNNIVTFAKNLTLKDSKLYYNAETPLSEWWGRMLVKYEEYGLTYAEALQVVYFINQYNAQIASELEKTETFLMLIGLEKADEKEEGTLAYKGINYKVKDGSLVDQLIQSTTDKLVYCKNLYKRVPNGTEIDGTVEGKYYKLSSMEPVSLIAGSLNEPIPFDTDNATYSDRISRIYCVPMEGTNLLGEIYFGELYATNRFQMYLTEKPSGPAVASDDDVYYEKLDTNTIEKEYSVDGNQTYTPDGTLLEDFLVPIDITTDVYNKYKKYYFRDGNSYKIELSRRISALHYKVQIKYRKTGEYHLIKRNAAPGIVEDLLTIKNLLGNGFSNSGGRTVDNVTPFLFTDEFIDTADKICKNIAQAIIILLSVDYIPVKYATSSNTEYKYAATTREKAKLLDGEQLPYVSLRIQNTNIPFENGSGETSESYLNTLNLPSSVAINSGVKSLDVAFIYKELNPMYREILDSKTLEVFIASLDNGQFSGIPVTAMSKVGADFTIPVSCFTQEREAHDVPYLIQDYYNYIPRTKHITYYFYLNQETNEIYIYTDSTHSTRLDRNNKYYLLVEREDRSVPGSVKTGTFYAINRNDEVITTKNIDVYNSAVKDSSPKYASFTVSNNFLILDSANNPLIYQVTDIVLEESGIEGTIQLRQDYNEEVVSKTTKLFKYRYGNPYLARRAAESDIITYYIGDEYISNSYGKFKYQQKEIRDFLKVYAQTREYFYRVLLNESFINDKEYPLYEKTFILFTSIERFLTKKVENLKDIDSYDETDIANFLASYGLDKLSSLMVSTNFLDEESFSKSILENYINLVQNKGSRKVIDILSEALSVGNKDMSIYKILFYHDISDGNLGLNESSDPSVDPYKYYKFIRADYSLDNIYEYINNNKDSSMDMATFLENTDNPDLWKLENTSPADLKKVGFEIGNTKFIVPELKTEISSEYWLTRINMEIIIHLIEYIDENNDNYTSAILGDTEIFKQSGDITLGTAMKGLLYLLTYYYHILYGTEGNDGLDEIITYKNQSPNFILTPVTTEFEYNPEYGHGLGSERCKDITDKLNELFFYVDEESSRKKPRLIYDVTGRSDKSVEKALSYIFGGEASFNEMFSNTVTAGRLIIDTINSLIILGSIVDNDGKSQINNDLLNSYLDNTSKTLLTGLFTPIENLVFNYISGVYIKTPISADALYIIELLINKYLLGNSTFNVLSVHRLSDSELPKADNSTFFEKLEERTDSLFNIDILLGSLYSSISEITSDEITPLKEAIITVADLIETTLASTLQFNFDGKDDNLLQFLRLAIEYFISYTTEIYRFRSVLTYNTLGETPASLFDDVSVSHLKITTHPLDSFYYDEALDILEGEILD